MLEPEPPLGEGDVGPRPVLRECVEAFATSRLGGVVGRQGGIRLGDRLAQPVALEHEGRRAFLRRRACRLRGATFRGGRLGAARRLGRSLRE